MPNKHVRKLGKAGAGKRQRNLPELKNKAEMDKEYKSTPLYEKKAGRPKAIGTVRLSVRGVLRLLPVN